jgi:hypothetical protein
MGFDAPSSFSVEVLLSSTQPQLEISDEIALSGAERPGHAILEPVRYSPNLVRHCRNTQASRFETNEAKRFRPQARKDDRASPAGQPVTSFGLQPPVKVHLQVEASRQVLPPATLRSITDEGQRDRLTGRCP